MWVYIIKRIFAFIPTVFIVLTLIFVLTRIVPGDPAWVLVGHQGVTQEKVEEVRRQLGLDKPILIQYITWLPKVFKGDFGESIFYRRPVIELISERFTVTLSLASLALFLTLIVAFPLGILSATNHNTLIDNVSMVSAVLGVSLPQFWLGFLFIILFSVTLRWFPTSGYRRLSFGFIPWIRYLVLPVLALSLSQIALLTRIIRSSMLEVLGKEYIVTAQAKGLSQGKVVYKHALKNAMITIITAIGLVFALSLGGSVIIENVFAIPGLGRLIVTAAVRRDYPIIEGGMLYLTGIALLINLFVDISYTFINPQVMYE